MHSTLIVARMEPQLREPVGKLFADFDKTDVPNRMGTLRRQLFHYRGLYFHLQDFADEHGGEAIEEAKTLPEFVQISADLKQYIQAYDPQTWRSPRDAMATRFYDWSR
jgi:cyclase